MIVVRLRGGLGNQMFQYAAGKTLALHHNIPLKLDVSQYSTPFEQRVFELYKFNVVDPVATFQECRAFILDEKNFVFEQPYYHFYEGFFQLPSDLYLSGYWQSERYFHKYGSLILELFQPRSPLSHLNQKMIDKFSSENSVSIHVRRGDYVSGKHVDFFKALDIAYYMVAIKKMEELYGNVKFYIFSDDIEWCKKDFDQWDNISYIDHNIGDESYLDMILMAACKHNIIANSTFSWWGAWLNTNPQKAVIAPQKWFSKDYRDNVVPVYADRFYNTKDLIQDCWMML